jgi:hypothetical protein
MQKRQSENCIQVHPLGPGFLESVVWTFFLKMFLWSKSKQSRDSKLFHLLSFN